MGNLNSVIVEGNLVRDPKTANTPRGRLVCNFSVANNRYFKSSEGEPRNEVSFFDIETWSREAERCSNDLEKGQAVRIVGRLKQDRWQDANGKNCTRVKIIADHVEYKTLDEQATDSQAAERPTPPVDKNDREVIY